MFTRRQYIFSDRRGGVDRGMELRLAYSGFTDYLETLRLQRKLWELRTGDGLPDTLLLTEHDHTITMGRNADKNDLLLSADELISRGIPVYAVERGGECTYHGPGQLTGYPIIRLQNERGAISRFVTRLEDVMIKTLFGFGIGGARRDGLPGVWAGEKKIGSVGVAVRRRVTYHGFALNINTDLSYYRFVRPCGMDWQVMTSMEQILGHRVNMAEVTSAVLRNFVEIFEAEVSSRNVEDIAQTGLAGCKVGV